MHPTDHDVGAGVTCLQPGTNGRLKCVRGHGSSRSVPVDYPKTQGSASSSSFAIIVVWGYAHHACYIIGECGPRRLSACGSVPEAGALPDPTGGRTRSEEHTSELQSL